MRTQREHYRPQRRFLGKPVAAEPQAAACAAFKGSCVLVSGAGGSIGSELCRQLAACGAARLILLERSEFALYQLLQELEPLARRSGTALDPVLGSVCDSGLVRRIMAGQRIGAVIHAAAYKHVPLVEMNPLAGLENNVLGTLCLARAARDAGAGRFILISSDKAVRPANVMGASKRLAEQVVRDLASRGSDTAFATVRFGNVLGSSGSVLPLFREQVRRGGPVTVTDPRAKRYFMTIGEAARLVLTAGATACGGEVFVLDMGDPVPVLRLAWEVIREAGLSVRGPGNPDGDIEIRITGLRPGEKLIEELALTRRRRATGHPRIFTVEEVPVPRIEVAAALRGLRRALACGDEDAARALAARWVEGTGPAQSPACRANQSRSLAKAPELSPSGRCCR
jgi:FlaA1/EpsC-like NDP-sugar epimerase